MRTITTYKIINGKVIKSERGLRMSRGPYPGDLPFHENILNQCYALECQGKLPPDLNNKRVRDVHRQMVEYGDFK